MDPRLASRTAVKESGGAGCGWILPPLIGLGIAAWLLRDWLRDPTAETVPPEIIFAGFIVLVSISIGFALRRRRRTTRAAGPPAAGPVEPIGESASIQRGAKNVGRLVFGIFLLSGLGFMIPFGFMFWGLIDSRGWEEIRCTVTSSGVGVHSGDDGSTYSIDIRYRYEWNGQEYSGDRYHFSSFGSSSGYQGKADVVERYPVGSEAPCWVDPDDPEESVLARKVGWEALFVLLPLVFVIIGLLGGLATFGVFGRKRAF